MSARKSPWLCRLVGHHWQFISAGTSATYGPPWKFFCARCLRYRHVSDFDFIWGAPPQEETP